MPFLDVTSVLLDPDFADSFVVRRRAQSTDVHGRLVVAEVRVQAIGVVTAVSPSDLDRREDYEAMSRSIIVVTKFRAQGETTGFQPDVIVWRGDNFVVKHVDPYPQFGNGFYQIEASSMDKTDAQFLPLASAGFSFNSAANSAYTGVR